MGKGKSMKNLSKGVVVINRWWGGDKVVGISSRRQSIKWDFGKLTVLSPLPNNDWPQENNY